MAILCQRPCQGSRAPAAWLLYLLVVLAESNAKPGVARDRTGGELRDGLDAAGLGRVLAPGSIGPPPALVAAPGEQLCSRGVAASAPPSAAFSACLDRDGDAAALVFRTCSCPGVVGPMTLGAGRGQAHALSEVRALSMPEAGAVGATRHRRRLIPNGGIHAVMAHRHLHHPDWQSSPERD